jgi:hypothetical protein
MRVFLRVWNAVQQLPGLALGSQNMWNVAADVRRMFR